MLMLLNLNMIHTTIHHKTSTILKTLDRQECIKTTYLKDNLLFNLEWCLPNQRTDNQVECIQTQICYKHNLLPLNLIWWLPNHHTDNQGEFIQTQICHKLNMVYLNLVLFHPNNTVNLELLLICHHNNMEFLEICHRNNMEPLEICHHNNMEPLEICHKANQVILQCKINMHNNHPSIDKKIFFWQNKLIW